MSCPHLSPDTMAACTQAAFDYDPAYYCIFHWNYADYPPLRKYHGLPTKWLGVSVYRNDKSEFGNCVLRCGSENGPGLLRQLRQALDELPGPAPAPAPPKPPPMRLPGQGWIACAPQTTQVLPAFPVRFP
ncbi:MAG: hypothetical protein ACRYFX_08870 [Janthinobacterium lividum]